MKKILFMLTLLVLSISKAEIFELKSIEDLKLNKIDSSTLVVFDIDNTLIRQKSMIGTHQWGDYMRERELRKGTELNKAKEYQQKAFAELQTYVSVLPVESKTLDVLKFLQSHQIKHFALTARAQTLKEITLKQLKVINHSFVQSFPVLDEPELVRAYLHEGVIFSGDTPKGELLKTIVSHSLNKFNKIIFIDDRRYNLESVEKSFLGEKTILESYRYGAADKIAQAFNPQIADIEYSVLKDHSVLISDEEAGLAVGSAQKLVDLAFNLFVLDGGALVKPVDGCNEVKSLSKNTKEVRFNCDYIYDGEHLSSVAYTIIKDEFTGGYYYGQW